MNARELHYKLFGDEVDHCVDALAYSLFTSRIKQVEKPIWKFIKCKGVGDNNGYWELSVTPASQDKE
jgi:hypothetical protein